jgi:16S rRNA (guanine527-N7)-methyltransferase
LHVKRLRELCAHLGLPSAAERRLGLLLELLEHDPEAPTSVTDPAEAVDVHIADSLSALPLIRPLLHESGPIVDIGSGAGLPGLPLAVVLEPVEVDLLEAAGRKCAFIERAIESLGQRNARCVCARAEDWGRGEGAGRYAAATARALAPLATLVEYASPLLRPAGVLVAWKGGRDPDEEEGGRTAAAALGMTAREILLTKPFPTARHHHLHVFEKTAATPPGFPRRPGVARKRPLGS